MKILRTGQDINLQINTETDFFQNLGAEESLQQFEEEVLEEIINPGSNYETARYIHKPYPDENPIQQTDIEIKIEIEIEIKIKYLGKKQSI